MNKSSIMNMNKASFLTILLSFSLFFLAASVVLSAPVAPEPILNSSFCKELAKQAPHSVLDLKDEKIMMKELLCRQAVLEVLKVEINKKLASSSDFRQISEITIPISYAIMMIGSSMSTGKLIYQTYKNRSILLGMQSLVTQTSGKVYLSLAGGGLLLMTGQKLLLKLNASQLIKLQNELETTKKILSQIQEVLTTSLDEEILLTPKKSS